MSYDPTMLPASLFSLTAWCAIMGDSGKVPQTIKAHLCRLRSAHLDRGHSDLSAFEHPVLDRTIRGIKRVRGEGLSRERKPITRDVSLKILGTFDVSTRQGGTQHASFCLAFAALLRTGECTYSSGDLEAVDFSQWRVTRALLVLSLDSLDLTLRSSKTDPLRNSCESPACAVDSLRHVFTVFPAPPGAPLFEAVLGEAFSASTVTQTLRIIHQRLNLQGHYSGYSFRRGTATHARDAGLPDSTIQLLAAESPIPTLVHRYE